MRLNKNTILIISIFIGLTLGTGYFINIRSIRNEIDSARLRTTIVAASKDLAPGDVLTPDRLTDMEFPSSHLSKRAIRAEDIELITNHTLLHPVPAGEPVLWTDLPEAPRIKYPTEEIPQGYRAMAIPADEVSTLSHLLTPGDRVDILWAHLTDTSTSPKAEILLERITILAVGKQLTFGKYFAGNTDLVSSITILVKPSQAKVLVKALQTGQITLLARGRGIIPLLNASKASGDSVPGSKASVDR